MELLEGLYRSTQGFGSSLKRRRHDVRVQVVGVALNPGTPEPVNPNP